tara:strand:- start:129 stop:7904 length:7776 start_codon:yes stop_codon:yes gene_type:complete
MAELKRNFSGGKMNKDMDERVLEPGQYRDARNVQLATSDGSNVGSLQTLLGNTKVSGANTVNDDYSSCVGVLPVPEKDLIYYFIAGGGTKNFVPLKKVDYIIEYDVNTKTTKYVFVDLYSVTHTIAADQAGGLFFDITTSANHNDLGIRPGMILSGTLNDPNGSGVNAVGQSLNFGVEVTNIQFSGMTGNQRTYRIYHSGSSGLLAYGNPFYATAGDVVTFTAPRVLEFQHHRMITAINHLDGMIFWTDNYNEPKKIHIERSKLGTCGTLPLGGHIDGNLWTAQAANVNNVPQPISQNNNSFHTRLLRKREKVANAFEVCLDREESQPIFVEKADITVLKRAPLSPLDVEMSTTESYRTDGTTENTIFSTSVGSGNTMIDLGDGSGVNAEHLEVGDQIDFDVLTPVDYRVGDTIMLTSNLNLAPDNFPLDQVEARITIITSPVVVIQGNATPSTGTFTATIQSIDIDAPTLPAQFLTRLEQPKPMFEYKFPRFSYRYKYTDGEYSTFAPFSEIAFLPGDFDYLPKKGYNLGMTNRVRHIRLKNYFNEFDLVPDDICEVDLLYKETQSKTVYSVKTIKRGDDGWPDMKADPSARGCFDLDTELIHATIPSNQLLRPYDNVPKCAKAQEITANRLVYGNYKQNYTISKSLQLNVQHAAYKITDSGITDYEIPLQSLKSMRTYQLGVVWLDGLGRETPVMVPETGGSITVDKKDADKQNRIKVKILEKSNGGFDPPPWARYLKYYIKETSNEYYNMAMDRFYDAEDGNVWISFPSAERNKVDESSYLILKKQHNSNTPVKETARYKVIAISNEAPLFIKRERNSFGMQTVEFESAGTPEPDRTFVIIDLTDFNQFFRSFTEPVIKDNVQVRFGGISGAQAFTSDVYEVNGINVSTTGGTVRLILDRPLGDDVQEISQLSRTTQMRLELFENKFENKPEFDGRFFVKILKDLTLQEELLSGFSLNLRYRVVDTFNLGYINAYKGRGKTWYRQWRDYHDGPGPNGHQTVESRWVIDDQDSGPDGTENTIQTRNLNKGGIYNAIDRLPNMNPLFGQSPMDSGGNTGNGYIDLSYINFVKDDPRSQNTRYSAVWDRIRMPGCHFRFKQDPAQVVFRVEGVQGRLWENYQSGDFCRLWKNTRYSDSTNSWSSENGRTGTLIGSSGDAAWNYEDDEDLLSANRWSARIKVDKMFGGGSNHVFDSSRHAPMQIADPNNVSPGNPNGMRMIQDGERYDGAIVGGTFTIVDRAGNSHTNTYPVGYNHNWYPITSDTGAQLNTANQLEAATVFNNNGNSEFSAQSWGASPILFHGNTNTGNYSSFFSNPDPDNNPADGTGGKPDFKAPTSVGLGGYSRRNDHTCIVEFLEPEIVTESEDGPNAFSSTNPAIWETEPKEDIGLDIYYEASGAIPINPDHTEDELLIPIGSTFKHNGTTHTVTAIEPYDPARVGVSKITITPALTAVFPHYHYAYFERYDNSKICLMSNFPSGTPAAIGTTVMHFITGDNSTDLGSFISRADAAPHHNPTVLGWFNCYSFGNGVESDRIRDDFNAKRIDNGVKASTTLDEPYAEEHRKNGFIWSGIYNSTSGVNNLNQFIQAEPITKDLNPDHGSIQKMVTRDTNTLAFCEDKVLKILTNKDALFNADGNSNVTSTNNVLGQAVPLPGEYGISTYPESLTSDPDGFYWADVQRGNVLTLRGDQIVSISDMGMKDYFNDNLRDLASVIGSYDEKKKEYNISLKKKSDASQFRFTGTTLSFSQLTSGWVSFKDYLPEAGLSINNEYYTFRHGSLWQHHTNETRNNFYGTQYTSDVTLIFNDAPGSVKSFGSINYEGTAAAVTTFTTESVTNAAGTTANYTDGQYYTLFAKTGWYIEDITTNLQDTGLLEFKNKEGKYFSTIRGKTTELSNLDEREFSVQGLGFIDSIGTSGQPPGVTYKIYIQGTHSNDGGNGPASSNHSSWDSTPDDPNWRVLFKQPLNGVAGATIAAGSRESYITNEQSFNGSQWVAGYSGLNLSAQDFSVPGGVASTSGTGNATIYKYTRPNSGSWNADPGITEVQFSNVNIDANFNETPGIPGDPANRVKIETFYSSFSMPSGNQVLKHDVDFNGQSPPTGGRLRDVCVRVSYDEIPSGSVSGNDRVTIAYTDLSDFTETADASYLPDPITTIKHTGTVTEGQTTMVAKYTITADSDYYLTNMGGGQASGVDAAFFPHLASQPWAGAYSFNYINTYHTSSGNTSKIASTIVEIFYTPPTGPGWEAGDPDSSEGGGFCSFLHEIRLNYLARSLATITTQPKAQSITANPTNVSVGNNLELTINSTAAGNIGIVVVKPQEGNDKFVTLSGATNNEVRYVWSSSWADAETPVVNTITLENGTTSVDVNLDANASSTAATYNVYGVDLGGDNLDLSSNFPTVSSPLVVTSQANVSTNITATLLTNMANETGFTNIVTSAFTGQPNSTAEIIKPIDMRFKTTSGSFTVTKQPEDIDVIGGDINLALVNDAANGNSTITVPANGVDGLSTGMTVTGPNVQSGTTITNINNTVVTLSKTLTADTPQGEVFSFGNGFTYSAKLTATKESETQVTLKGKITCKGFGATGGNITIKTGNFLTIS